LSWGNKVGLLFAIWSLGVGLSSFVLVLAWSTSVTAGHTKRITTNTIILISYGIGNTVAQFMWQAKYKPRNYVPWGIIAGCYFICGIIPLVIRWILARENALRDKEEYDSTYDDIYIEHTTPEGKKVGVKVPKVRPPSTSRFWCPI
jgi:ACS family allantoate permease-like MFS transporter